MSTGISFQASLAPFNTFEKSLESQATRPTDSPNSTPSVAGDPAPMTMSGAPWLSSAVPSVDFLTPSHPQIAQQPQYPAQLPIVPQGYMLVSIPQQQQQSAAFGVHAQQALPRLPQQPPQAMYYFNPATTQMATAVPRQQPQYISAAPATVPYVTSVPVGLGSMDDGPKQLIINFLDPEVTNIELHNAFSAIGPLEAARVIYDKVTSRSKGFGFVYYKYSRDAAAALQCMTGHPIRGRRIKVSLASPQRPAPVADSYY